MGELRELRAFRGSCQSLAGAWALAGFAAQKTGLLSGSPAYILTYIRCRMAYNEALP